MNLGHPRFFSYIYYVIMRETKVMSLTETPIPVLIKKRNFITELNRFIEYCNDFYNIEKGIYPIATKDVIINAVGEYLTEPHQIEIQFDSIDREMVRKIIQPEYQF